MSLYSEERHDDDELVAKVEKVVQAREEAMGKASELMEEALTELNRYSAFVGDELYANQVKVVTKACRSLTEAMRSAQSRDAEEEYLRQQAGGILGIQVENMGGSFPL